MTMKVVRPARSSVARSVPRWRSSKKPSISAVRPSSGRTACGQRSRAGPRVVDGLAPVGPGAVRLRGLPGAHAVVLRAQHVLDERARVGVEGGVEQALDVAVGGGRLVAQ